MNPSDDRTEPRFSGIIPPLITPLHDGGALDIDGLERLIEHVLAGGVHGLFVLGTCGEGPVLPDPTRRELVVRACEQVAGRVPILVGVTDTVLDRTLDLAAFAAKQGAAAVVLAPPFYLPPGPGELRTYVDLVAKRSPLPVILYDIRVYTKVHYDLETIRRAMDSANVVGFKDSSGDLGFFQEILALRDQHRPDWGVLVGPEHLLAPAVLMGGDGGVPGGAQIDPHLFVALYEAAAGGSAARANEIQADILDLGSIYRLTTGGAAVIKALKGALAQMGLCDDALAPPFDRLDECERIRLHNVLLRRGLIRERHVESPTLATAEAFA